MTNLADYVFIVGICGIIVAFYLFSYARKLCLIEPPSRMILKSSRAAGLAQLKKEWLPSGIVIGTGTGLLYLSHEMISVCASFLVGGIFTVIAVRAIFEFQVLSYSLGSEDGLAFSWKAAWSAGGGLGLMIAGLIVLFQGMLFFLLMSEYGAGAKNPAWIGCALGSAAMVLIRVSSGGSFPGEADMEWMGGGPAVIFWADLNALANLYAGLTTALAIGVANGMLLGDDVVSWARLPVLSSAAGLILSGAGLAFFYILKKKRARRSLWITFALFALTLFGIIQPTMRSLSSGFLAEVKFLDRFGPLCAAMIGLVSALFIPCVLNYYQSDTKENSLMYRLEKFAMPLFFLILSEWIAYLLADLYGVTIAAIGSTGISALIISQYAVRRVCSTERVSDGAKTAFRGYILTVSILASAGVLAYAVLVIKKCLDVNFSENYLEIETLIGILLGGGVLSPLLGPERAPVEKKFPSSAWSVGSPSFSPDCSLSR